MKNIKKICLSFVLLMILFFGCKKDEETTGPEPTAISGIVKNKDWQPVSAVSVVIPGKVPFVTDASGTFSFTDVTPPYDIYVINTSLKEAIIYKALYRPDPKLLVAWGTSTSKSATISGTVPTTNYSTSRTQAIFVCSEYSWSAIASFVYDPWPYFTFKYSIPPTWYDAKNNLSGKLFYLRYTPASGIPITYDGYAVMDSINLASGTSVTKNISAEITDPNQTSISGTVTQPTGYIIRTRTLSGTFENSKKVDLGTEGNSSATLASNFNYPVPSISSAKFVISALAEKPSSPTSLSSCIYKYGIDTGGTNISLTIEAAPELFLPGHNASDIVTTSMLNWKAGGGDGVYFIEIESTTGTKYRIYTRETNITIPNLEQQGLGLPSNTLYTWKVTKYYPISSTDNIASDTFRRLKNYELTMDWGYTISQTFSFRTKP